MELIRKGTFETNSSSTHAIVIPHNVREEDYNLNDSLDHNFEFGRENCRIVYEWDEKLAYIYFVLNELHNYQWDKDKEKISNDKIKNFKDMVNKAYKDVYKIVEYKPYKYDLKPNQIFKYIEKKGNLSLDEILSDDDSIPYVDHVGEFASNEYDDFINKLLTDYDFVKKLIFNKESYISIGGDEYNGYYIKTIGFQYDYDESEYPQYQINEKGEICPELKDFPDTDEGWAEYWETQKKYPIIKDNGGFWDKLQEYKKKNDVYLKGN